MDTPTFVVYDGNGSTTDFVFPFAYLDAEHILVTVGGVETAFTLPSQNTVRISPAPVSGDDNIRIERVTPGEALVNWADGAVILGRNLNTASAQPRYIAEEARNAAEEAKDIAAANVEDALQAVEDAEAQAALAEVAADAAASHAADALSTKTAIEGIYDAFDDRYLGIKPGNPTLDNDGNALQAGALYFNTSLQELRIWTGTEWLAAYMPDNDSGVISFNGRDGLVEPEAGDYAVADITGLTAALTGKAASIHGHAIADVTSLQTALDAKAADADVLKRNVEDQTITGGAHVTSKSLGTLTTGTLTLDTGDRPLQHYTNGGAHTLAPGSNAGSIIVDITNTTGAGAITTAGFTKVAGDAFTTTNGHKFRCSVVVGNAGSLLLVQAMQ